MPNDGSSGLPAFSAGTPVTEKNVPFESNAILSLRARK
jgi:hypothetical protein